MDSCRSRPSHRRARSGDQVRPGTRGGRRLAVRRARSEPGRTRPRRRWWGRRWRRTRRRRADGGSCRRGLRLQARRRRPVRTSLDARVRRGHERGRRLRSGAVDRRQRAARRRQRAGEPRRRRPRVRSSSRRPGRRSERSRRSAFRAASSSARASRWRANRRSSPRPAMRAVMARRTSSGASSRRVAAGAARQARRQQARMCPPQRRRGARTAAPAGNFTWTEIARLAAPASSRTDRFAASVASSENEVWVGAPGAGGPGRVFVFPGDAGGFQIDGFRAARTELDRSGGGRRRGVRARQRRGCRRHRRASQSGGVLHLRARCVRRLARAADADDADARRTAGHHRRREALQRRGQSRDVRLRRRGFAVVPAAVRS